MKKTLLIVFPLIFIWGCGPDISGQWQGSGEFFQGHTFSISFTVGDSNKISADFTDNKGLSKQIVVCDLHHNRETGEVSFSFNPFADTQDCATLHDVYLFQGELGYGVITGELRDVNDKTIGIFRALKILK